MFMVALWLWVSDLECLKCCIAADQKEYYVREFWLFTLCTHRYTRLALSLASAKKGWVHPFPPRWFQHLFTVNAFKTFNKTFLCLFVTLLFEWRNGNHRYARISLSLAFANKSCLYRLHSFTWWIFFMYDHLESSKVSLLASSHDHFQIRHWRVICASVW